MSQENAVGLHVYSFMIRDHPLLTKKTCKTKTIYYIAITGCLTGLGPIAQINTNNGLPSVVTIQVLAMYNHRLKALYDGSI